ncbi:universal stress protein [Kutzneria sp. CA-103260]|uniref:universal stress protein n=1 Tax=Kutzneria sp. CA-103260 TaxID=2802641 RepID=UPI001BA7A67D|nr:universal stress protein [Kutzneria sp. CA-103260]QUQ64386.1 universal stress protein [Kutzneria sp. CA-103260]
MHGRGRRVVVGVDGSPGSLRAVAEARSRGAALVSALAWYPAEGEMVHRPGVDRYLRELRESSAWQRLTKAWDDALGGVPPDVDPLLVVACGRAGPVLVDIADEENDLLVVGAGSRNRLRRALIRSVPRYCAARAGCPVLVVPPSPLTPAWTLTRP